MSGTASELLFVDWGVRLAVSTWPDEDGCCAASGPADRSDGLTFKAFNTSTGISAKPIIMLPMVPRRAAVAPDIGSQGPSSESYSRGRYLKKVSRQDNPAYNRNLRFEVIEV